jgi:hypothetical protein
MSTGSDKRICAICAWREKCVKRYKHQDNPLGDINCPDFTRDVLFKDNDEHSSGDLLKGNKKNKYPYVD